MCLRHAASAFIPNPEESYKTLGGQEGDHFDVLRPGFALPTNIGATLLPDVDASCMPISSADRPSRPTRPIIAARAADDRAVRDRSPTRWVFAGAKEGGDVPAYDAALHLNNSTC